MKNKIITITFFCIALMMLIFCENSFSTSSESTNSSINNNNLGISIGDGSGESITNFRNAPTLPNTLHNEIPSYFGEQPSHMWNTQEFTILPLYIKSIKEFNVIYRLFGKNLTKSKVDVLICGLTKKHKVKVINGFDDFLKLKSFRIVGSVTAHANYKQTTIECFKQALIDTGSIGGNVFVLLSAKSCPENRSSTFGLGSSGAGNFGMSGKDSYAGGAVTGFAFSSGGPARKPFVQGLIIEVPEKVYKNLP